MFNFEKNGSMKDFIASLVKYYTDGEISEKDFKKAIKQVRYGNFNAVLAKCYSSCLSKLVIKSQEFMRSKGRVTGYAPIGYRNIRHGNGKYDIIPDKNSEDIVALFKLFAFGYSIETLKVIAEKSGLVGKKSKKPLEKKNIIYILNNPFYCGYARHKGELYEHCYKSIITKSLYNKCQKKLKRLGYKS